MPLALREGHVADGAVVHSLIQRRPIIVNRASLHSIITIPGRILGLLDREHLSIHCTYPGA
jgi:hypothetical protein